MGRVWGKLMEELLLIILQATIEIFGEFLLEAFPDVLAEIFAHSFKAGKGDQCKRLVAIIGYLLLGQGIGIVSVWIFPHSFIHSYNLRLVNLFLTPLLTAAILTFIGIYRGRKGQDLVSIDKFWYAYSFAFSTALARFALVR